MKNYVKPMVLANEELAEGVFAASGDCCFVYPSVYQRDPDGTHRMKIYYLHRASNDHCNTGCEITLNFTTAVTLTDTSGYAVEGNGTTRIVVKVANALHSDGDCQTEFVVVGKANDGSTFDFAGSSITDRGYWIVDDHIKQ